MAQSQLQPAVFTKFLNSMGLSGANRIMARAGVRTVKQGFKAVVPGYGDVELPNGTRVKIQDSSNGAKDFTFRHRGEELKIRWLRDGVAYSHYKQGARDSLGYVGGNYAVVV